MNHKLKGLVIINYHAMTTNRKKLQHVGDEKATKHTQFVKLTMCVCVNRRMATANRSLKVISWMFRMFNFLRHDPRL